MNARTVLALVLASFATAACAADQDIHGGSGKKLDVDNRGSVIEGRLLEDGVAIEFRIERRTSTRFSVTGRDGFKLIDSTRTNGIDATTILETSDRAAIHDLSAMPEANVIRDLPRVLAIQGIDIDDIVEASPGLRDVFCPTRSVDPEVQSDNLDLDTAPN